MNRRKICVVTGSRAEYGLLFWLMREIDNDTELNLQLIVTGMHLSPEFGLTYQQIEKDGFNIDKKIEMLLSSDSEIGTTKAVGLGCIGFADALQELRPDIMVLLGDRFEILAAAIAAVIARIPIAHLHGGEVTEGAFDESIRHAVTKMSSFHFPATEKYAHRIIQMGETSDRVFNYGMPGLDNIYRLNLLKRDELEKELNFVFTEKNAIVTYHPVTLEKDTGKEQIDTLLRVISELNMQVIFTRANADTGGRGINQRIEEFVSLSPDKYKLFDSLGQQKYLSLLKQVDLMIGNSSSGLTEGPSFKLPVINIEDRQKGRIKAKNVIDVACNYNEIKEAIQKGLTDSFKQSIKNMINPYDKYRDGKISFRIKEKLKDVELNEKILKKSFFDL